MIANESKGLTLTIVPIIDDHLFSMIINQLIINVFFRFELYDLIVAFCGVSYVCNIASAGTLYDNFVFSNFIKVFHKYHSFRYDDVVYHGIIHMPITPEYNQWGNLSYT